MATLNQEGIEDSSSQPLTVPLLRLRWTQLLSISILAFAFNFHWAAIGLIILPDQVYHIVGDLNKGTALAFVLVPGAFVALFSNPLFGWLSDRTGGKLAAWGRRRPYIFVGILINIAGLAWMASARDIPTLALAYVLTQFFSNAAQAPFHALLPDIVPAEQRGLASGILGLLGLIGTVGGLIAASMLINTKAPLAAYQQSLWVAYGVIMAIIFVLMLITISSVRDRPLLAVQDGSLTEAGEEKRVEEGVRRSWISRSVLITIVGTVVAVLAAWGLITLWNAQNVAGIQINSNIQQVILELLVVIGILRLFDFNPRRDPDFAWVLGTRLVLMLGIYTIQSFLQYYMKDAVGAANPGQATTLFGIVVSLTSLVTAFLAGWLSDHFGRKRMVYIAGFLMALVGLVFVVTHSLPIVLAAGALFGLGYGAYQSVDWALVVDVLPSKKNFARDMGVWNIAVSMAQVIAPALGGPIIDSYAHAGNPVLGFQVLFSMAILYCMVGTVTVHFIRGVKN